MIAQVRRRIINITSVHEDWPMPGNTPYCLSKGGMRMLTRTAGIELGQHGITVTGVGPGAVATPINAETMDDPTKMATLDNAIPLGRMAQPQEIGSVVAFLAGDGASYLTATTIFADGGIMHSSPGLVAMTTAEEAPARHRVVVVGAGFGGLPAVRLLGHAPVDVTLVDRRNYHLFQPLLYQVATGMLSPGQIAPPIRHVVRRLDNVRVELAEVSGFDLDRRIVHAASAAGQHLLEIPYDSLIVAAGVQQSYFGHDELARYAPG